MKNLKWIRKGKQKIYLAFSVLFIIASSGTIYYYNTLLSRSGLYAVAGTQENYSWAIAKFAIRLAEFDVFIERQKKLIEKDIDEIKLQNEILQSRYYVLSNLSESTEQLFNEPGYTKVIEQIGMRLEAIDKLINNHNESIDLDKINNYLSQVKPYSIKMANLTDHAEVKQRSNAYEDFLIKRKIIFFALSVIIFSTMVLLINIIINILQLRRTIRQQAKAISAEQAAILAASESVRTKNAFLGALGHELRTSLQTVMAAVDVLNNSAFQKNHVGTLRSLELATQQIDVQMKDLTDYAKLDNGMMELHMSTFNLELLIESIINDISKIWHHKIVSLLVDIKAENKNLKSDPTRIRQIITNLLTNAFKYTEKGTIILNVSITKKLNKDFLLLEISDTGIGIPEEKLELIFSPFLQVDTSYTRLSYGVGMGLAIVKALVDLFDGTIQVTSQLNVGTKFNVCLPIVLLETVGKHENFNISEKQPYVDFSNYFILVIDDHQSALDALALLLKEIGCQYELCNSSENAIKKLIRRPYDILLLDLQMPYIDGISIAKKLRNNRGPNRHIPIIGVSAYTPEKLSTEQRELFDDYLTKPVRLDALFTSFIHAISKTKD